MKFDLSALDSSKYSWNFRAIPNLDIKNSYIDIFTRNDKVRVTHQLGFDVEALGISSGEYLANAIASDILFAIINMTKKKKIELYELEGCFTLVLDNPLTFIGVKGCNDKPIFSELNSIIYVSMGMSEDKTISLCQYALNLAPVYNTLNRVLKISITFKPIL